MDMDDVRRRVSEIEVEDPLEPLGVVGGVLLILVGLGTVVGMPWQYNTSVLVSVVQLLGILSAIAIGAGLIWVALLPRRERED